jgi:large subunit ribosomal protein L19
MDQLIRRIEERYKRAVELPDFRVGDTVRVYYRVIEGGKERIQPFEGLVIRFQGSGLNRNFTVRKESYGVGIERTFPMYNPRLERVEIIKFGKVRRAKLYYIRQLSGKTAARKIKEIKPWEPLGQKRIAQARAKGLATITQENKGGKKKSKKK